MLDVLRIDLSSRPSVIGAHWPRDQLGLKLRQMKLTARFCLATDIDMMDCR
jgi:hypothetical protein